jgi:hypothetical protein
MNDYLADGNVYFMVYEVPDISLALVQSCLESWGVLPADPADPDHEEWRGRPLTVLTSVTGLGSAAVLRKLCQLGCLAAAWDRRSGENDDWRILGVAGRVPVLEALDCKPLVIGCSDSCWVLPNPDAIGWIEVDPWDLGEVDRTARMSEQEYAQVLLAERGRMLVLGKCLVAASGLGLPGLWEEEPECGAGTDDSGALL